jgi:glycosyltransferase involved in cell wall biosynthesis
MVFTTSSDCKNHSDCFGKGNQVAIEPIKVTIMIPTYNQATYICEAVESALSQNYPYLEVIVGDDASTDDTMEICRKINNPRLRYIRNESNIGRVANYRNLLFKHSRGDYVVNLDGDDFYTSNDFISEAVKCVGNNEPEVVMVVAKATRKSREGEWTSKISNRNECSGLQILSRLPKKEYLMMHMAVLYSRRHAIEANFYRIDAISSDWESLFRLSLRGVVRFLDKNIGIWRIHDRNETGTTKLEKHLVNLTIWQSIYKESINFGMNPIMANIICARCVAYFAQSSCAIVSKDGNMALARFTLSVISKYKLATFFLVFTPSYLGRLVLCLMGYYRRKSL